MATSKQEQTYNKMIEYYAYADLLIKEVEHSLHPLASQQFTIIEEMVNRLEECADQLTTKYIEFVKSGDASEIVGPVRTALNDISTKIGECRNKILVLYHQDKSSA